MARNVVVGCSVALGVFIICLWIGTYFFVYRPLKGYVQEFAKVEQIEELNKQVANQSTYQPPADGRLTAEQVSRYVQVQADIKANLGPRFEALDEKYKRLSAEQSDSERTATLREIMEAYKDVIGVVISAKEAQVTALNRAEFSLGEYEWVRGQSLAALGFALSPWSFDQFLKAAREGGMPEPPPPPDIEALEYNRQLLAEHRKDFEEWYAFSFFGL